MTNIILDKVKLVIKTSKPDGIVTRLRHNQELWPDILEFTKSFEFKNKAEQVYFYSQQFTNKPLCKCGNSVTFVTITSGYREFCSRECNYAKNAALERRVASMKSNGGVGENYYCYGNPLVTLSGLPTQSFYLLNLNYSPTLPLMRSLVANRIEFNFAVSSMKIRIAHLLNKYAGQGKAGMMKCSSELLTLGKELGVDLRQNARW